MTTHAKLDHALLMTLGLSAESAEIVMQEIETLRADVDAYGFETRDCYQRIAWLEQQREVECQQKEAALRESAELLAEKEESQRLLRNCGLLPSEKEQPPISNEFVAEGCERFKDDKAYDALMRGETHL